MADEQDGSEARHDLDRVPPSRGHVRTFNFLMITIHPRYSYLDYLEETFDFVTTEEIGKSYEGRALRVAKISK